MECRPEGRLGERIFDFRGNDNDNFLVGFDWLAVNDGEAILYDHTGSASRLRGVMHYGDYRSYVQSACFLNFENTEDFNRNDFLRDILTLLYSYHGVFMGRVVNNMSGEPVDSAQIYIHESRASTVTNAEGMFRIENIPAEQFTVSVSRWGYTAIDAAEFNFNGEHELDVEIRMQHPVIEIETDEISIEIGLNQTCSEALVLSNLGDGLLTFSSELSATPEPQNSWEMIDDCDVSEITGDPQLYDAVFFQDNYWIVGGGDADEPNMLYKVDRNLELVDSWEQGTNTLYGWRNITTDGEYLYAVESVYIDQIDPESGQATGLRIFIDMYPCYCITYDEVSDQFWITGPGEDIYRVDRAGNRTHTVERRDRSPVSGLAWCEDDIDGYKLYIINNLRNNNREYIVGLSKVNPNTQEALDVMTFETDGRQLAGGCAFSEELNEFNWTFLTIMQGDEDILRTYHAFSNIDWIAVEPMVGEVEPEDDMEMLFEFNSRGLEVNETYRSYLFIDHNTLLDHLVRVDLCLLLIKKIFLKHVRKIL